MMPTPEKTGINVIEDWFGDLMRPGDGEVLRKALDDAGWALGPKEPTRTMRLHGLRGLGAMTNDKEKICREVYRAMLAAAPNAKKE